MENEKAPEWALELIKSQTLMAQTLTALSGKVTQLENENKSLKDGIKDIIPQREEEATNEELDQIFGNIRI
ncbi:hypothetical protein [Sphingobacterium multivorum]|uniref:hypothetical protein n=1 Tax=Sphingobacterium multivorum TaxID=28454 RepID=UPI0028AF95BB|nr:hypothetical protein [Sphingobacterium multivorum]